MDDLSRFCLLEFRVPRPRQAGRRKSDHDQPLRSRQGPPHALLSHLRGSIFRAEAGKNAAV